MELNLLEEITTEKLLEKFGAGNHKPGSGSAAAFQGMLSAKLLVTVISLTNEDKHRSKYLRVLQELLKMSKDIQENIFPELTKLFHEDAIQFGKTITAREVRNNEKEPIRNNLLARAALSELKKSIEIPLEIARHCIKLADMAEFVFDNAFQSARGDSHVALSGSVAGLAGCISIIQLNLLSFGSDEYSWTSKKIEEAKGIKGQYVRLNKIATNKIEILESEVASNTILHNEVNKLLDQIKSKTVLTDKDIEKAATDFQNLMWTHKETIWTKKILSYPHEALQASTIFRKALGYKFAVEPSLGSSESDGQYLEIAGLINQKDRIVLISDNFEENTQNFTAAHELGHAILHKQTEMHRDRPIDGVKSIKGRNSQEMQADKFATYFLMPSKLVIQAFREMFDVSKFVINEDNTFNLALHFSPSKLREECRDLRGLTLKLASTERYFNDRAISLSNLFNVSHTAMARRLEELGLAEF